MVEATPPRRIRLSCSVKTRSFDNGYSRLPSVFRGSRGRGVKKNMRPTGVYRGYDQNQDKFYFVDVYTYYANVSKHAGKEVKFGFSFMLGFVFLDTRSL